jgi:hypothetical protein
LYDIEPTPLLLIQLDPPEDENKEEETFLKWLLIISFEIQIVE